MNYRPPLPLPNFLLTLMLFALFAFYSIGCSKTGELTEVNSVSSPKGSTANAVTREPGVKPNIIFILADDIGYEIPTYTGGQSHSTPNLDFLAASGTQFTQAHASPLCSPSRFMLMTGKYNFRNYFRWGVLGSDQRTLANLAKRAGYITCVSGKWQFDGGDQSIRTAGFDKYSVNEAFNSSSGNEASNDFYKDPTVYQNGQYLPKSKTKGKYGPDVHRDYVFNFIDSNKDKPFFVYWSMNLAHKPFSPTPDDATYATWVAGQKPKAADTIYHPSMVKYMDKQIGQLITKLQQMQLDKNTLIIFAGDNGTPEDIHSLWNGQVIEGGKFLPIERGHHVPLLAYMPGLVPGGRKDTSLIDFTDVMKTFADIFKTTIPAGYGKTDGVSFYPQLMGQSNANSRSWVFNHYLVHPEDNDGTAPKRWIQNDTYKEYDTIIDFFKTTKFYNIRIDPEEKKPIPASKRTAEEKAIYNSFKKTMQTLH
jgi:arylsulfatase A